MNTTHVIIVAAGKGSRFGSDVPKQFCMLGDYPVLMHTAISLGRALPRAKMAIVLSQDYADYWLRLCEKVGFTSPRIVIGGDTRWESVKNAIEALNPDDSDIVMIHDGVRPVLKSEMMRRISKAMDQADAVIPVVPVTDSLREIADDGSSTMVDRSKLMAVQTPQAFRGAPLKQAYAMPYQSHFTDDASVYEAAGFGSPALVEGSPLNIKITNPRDIEVAALFMGIR